jgi:tetratricopeptide (TPR) repeat protein
LTGINFRNVKLLYASVTLISLIVTAGLFYSVIPARVREGNKPRTGSWLELYYYTFYLEKNPRFFLIRDGLKVARQHFWLGSGPGTFRLTFAPVQSLDHAQVEPNGLYDSPHNNYLYILCTRGVFTLGVHLGILILIMKGGWKMLQRPQQVPLKDRFLAMALMSSMGIYVIWSLASFDSLSTLPTTFTLFALFSCLYSSHFPWVPSERWQKGLTWATRLFILAMIPLALAGIYYPYRIYKADQFFNLAKSARLATGRALADDEMGKAARLHDATVKLMTLATQANPYESSYYLEWMESNLEIYDHTADPRYVEDIMNLRERAYRHSWIPQKINHSMMRYYAMQKNIPAAISEGEQALNYTPHSTVLLNHLGKLYLMLKTERSLSQARESFDHVLRVDPRNEEALMAEAEMALKNNQFQLAGELAIRSGLRPPTNTEKIKKFLQLVERRSNAFNALPANPQTTNSANSAR